MLIGQAQIIYTRETDIFYQFPLDLSNNKSIIPNSERMQKMSWILAQSTGADSLLAQISRRPCRLLLNLSRS